MTKEINKTTEHISIDIDPGQTYNISVTAINPIGNSDVISLIYTSLSEGLYNMFGIIL